MPRGVYRDKVQRAKWRASYYQKNKLKWYDKSDEARAKKRADGQKPQARIRRRHRDLVNKYGIGIDEFNALALLQRHKCAVCHRTEKLVVDHDHSAGNVRALLCDRCNRAIGLLRDDPEVCLAAAEYLRSFTCHT